MADDIPGGSVNTPPTVAHLPFVVGKYALPAMMRSVTYNRISYETRCCDGESGVLSLGSMRTCIVQLTGEAELMGTLACVMSMLKPGEPPSCAVI